MRSRLAIPLLLLVATGCARATLKASVAQKHAGADMSLEFWDELAKVPSVSNRDALHAVMLSVAGAPDVEGFKAELKLAQERGWVSGALAPEETAKVGWIAKGVCIETGIKGGLTMRVFGPSARYCVRDLNGRGWLPNMSTAQTISGLQLVALLSKAGEQEEEGA